MYQNVTINPHDSIHMNSVSLSGTALIIIGSITSICYIKLAVLLTSFSQKIAQCCAASLYATGATLFFFGALVNAYAWKSSGQPEIAGIFFGEQLFISLNASVAGIEMVSRFASRIFDAPRGRIILLNMLFLVLSVIGTISYFPFIGGLDGFYGYGGVAVLAMSHILTLIVVSLQLLTYIVIGCITRSQRKRIYKFTPVGFIFCLLMLWTGYFVTAAAFPTKYITYFVGMGLYVLLVGFMIAWDMGLQQCVHKESEERLDPKEHEEEGHSSPEVTADLPDPYLSPYAIKFGEQSGAKCVTPTRKARVATRGKAPIELQIDDANESNAGTDRDGDESLSPSVKLAWKERLALLDQLALLEQRPNQDVGETSNDDDDDGSNNEESSITRSQSVPDSSPSSKQQQGWQKRLALLEQGR